MIRLSRHFLVGLFWILALGCAPAASAAVPPLLAAALHDFRSDPPHGWSFNQTTVAEGKSMVEHCDAARPEFDRWTLVRQNDRAPTEEELKDYAMARSQRSRSGTAPKITDQFDLPTLEPVSDTAERATYRCRLRPGDSRDRTAAFLRAIISVDKSSRTITSIELASVSEFSPTFGVTIASMSTVMTYSRPDADQPSLPQAVMIRVRGRAFLFKSLDSEMTVTFTDYAKVGGGKKL